jgi:hypothetical protein
LEDLRLDVPRRSAHEDRAVDGQHVQERQRVGLRLADLDEGVLHLRGVVCLRHGHAQDVLRRWRRLVGNGRAPVSRHASVWFLVCARGLRLGFLPACGARVLNGLPCRVVQGVVPVDRWRWCDPRDSVDSVDFSAPAAGAKHCLEDVFAVLVVGMVGGLGDFADAAARSGSRCGVERHEDCQDSVFDVLQMQVLLLQGALEQPAIHAGLEVRRDSGDYVEQLRDSLDGEELVDRGMAPSLYKDSICKEYKSMATKVGNRRDATICWPMYRLPSTLWKLFHVNVSPVVISLVCTRITSATSVRSWMCSWRRVRMPSSGLGQCCLGIGEWRHPVRLCDASRIREPCTLWTLITPATTKVAPGPLWTPTTRTTQWTVVSH